jgi:thiamine biosynthesis lipoprotein
MPMTLALHRFPFFAMGTQCELQLYAEDFPAAASAAQCAIDEVLRIESRYSRYRDDSILAEINRAAAQGTSLPIDEETATLLDYAHACHAKSDGLFDITSGVLRRAWDFESDQLPEPHRLDALLPLVGLHKLRWERPRLSFDLPGMELDFGGIAKVCRRSGRGRLHRMRHRAAVELGGDISVIGPHPDRPWIRRRHPGQLETTIPSGLRGLSPQRRALHRGGRSTLALLDPHGWRCGRHP